ncbi:MAG: hypothetical protein WC289_05585 [Patescibacteria group bacterium]
MDIVEKRPAFGASKSVELLDTPLRSDCVETQVTWEIGGDASCATTEIFACIAGTLAGDPITVTGATTAITTMKKRSFRNMCSILS